MVGEFVRSRGSAIQVDDDAAFVSGADEVGFAIAIVIDFSEVKACDGQPFPGHVSPEFKLVIRGSQPDGGRF